jgi:hypothetical protein
MNAFEAVLLGDLGRLKALVRTKEDALIYTKHKTSLFCAACLPPLDDEHRTNRFEIVKFLYSIGGCDLSPDLLGRTPFKVAMSFTPYNQGDVAAWLLLKHSFPVVHGDEDVTRHVRRLLNQYMQSYRRFLHVMKLPDDIHQLIFDFLPYTKFSR